MTSIPTSDALALGGIAFVLLVGLWKRSTASLRARRESTFST